MATIILCEIICLSMTHLLCSSRAQRSTYSITVNRAAWHHPVDDPNEWFLSDYQASLYGSRMLTFVDWVLCLVPVVTVSVIVHIPGFS